MGHEAIIKRTTVITTIGIISKITTALFAEHDERLNHLRTIVGTLQPVSSNGQVCFNRESKLPRFTNISYCRRTSLTACKRL